jgi:hypothetical protein
VIRNLRRFVTLFAALAGTAGSAAAAGELSGFVEGELRIFSHAPALPDQQTRRLWPSLALQPEYRVAWNGGSDRLTVVPFLRLDAQDPERTHADLRELNWLKVGRGWDLRLGVGKVFWGVTESRHLVDIVNQTDLVEDLDEEQKLGQPMVNLNVAPDWGKLSLFVLPGFRERTFPGRKGRLRFGLPVDTDRPIFESGARRHVDLAARWSHTLGDWDIGVAHFHGTAREPRLVVDVAPGRDPALRPRYDIIDQTSIDVQATLGAWLWKLEAMTRSGQGRRFDALVGGFEYTINGVFKTPADLGVLAENLYDGRDASAPQTPFDDDVFVGLRLALNDTQSSTVLAGVVVDRHRHSTAWRIEASRRLTDRWSIELDGRVFADIDPDDALNSFRRDDYLQFRLKRYF